MDFMESERPQGPRTNGIGQSIGRFVDRIRALVVVATNDRPTLEDQLRAKGRQTEAPRPTTAEAARQFPSQNPFRKE